MGRVMAFGRKMIVAAFLAGVFAAVAGAGEITAERAMEIALAQTGGGQVMELDRHYRGNGVNYYRLEILGGDGPYHAEIDAATGAILKLVRKGGYKGKYKGYRYPVASTPPSATIPSPPAPPASTPFVPGTSGGTAISMEQAMAIALQRTDGGMIIESEADYKKHGRVEYEFEIINNGTKYELELDSFGNIVEFKQKGGGYYLPRQPVAPAPAPGTGAASRTRLDLAAAQSLALKVAGEGTVTEYKLDDDNGRLVHLITIRQNGVKRKVEVDDASGEVSVR